MFDRLHHSLIHHNLGSVLRKSHIHKMNYHRIQGNSDIRSYKVMLFHTFHQELLLLQVAVPLKRQTFHVMDFS
jgi:hypothetical protein